MNERSLGAVPLIEPLYLSIKRKLLEAMHDGTYKPGDALPPEPKLAQSFGVSIGTVRRAVDELVSENLVLRYQGKGTFVITHNRDRLLYYFFHIVKHDGTKKYPRVELLSFERTRASQEAAQKLKLPAGARVVRVLNRLSLDDKPVCLDDIVLPDTRFATLTERQLRDRESTLYRLYQDAFHITVTSTEERLRAAVAGEEQSKWLGVEEGSPLLLVRRLALTYNEEPVEWRRSYVNTQEHEYLAFSQRNMQA
jgi:GntR family transcriptional regulator